VTQSAHRAASLDRLLHPRQQREIVDAVRVAELYTTSELKVHVEAQCLAPDPYTRAVQLLTELGVHLTEARNGVLIYVAVHDRRYAIVGDSGLGEPATSSFWKEPNRRMSIACRRGACGAGIVDALRELGPLLAKRFPAVPGSGRNEIENEISVADTAQA
jgi:uncharacterized membrane protein